ncbi:uncharacterized protein PGTG_11334 [Puccinia graminis f. sp. tritici CRL 75-36-700-3]|uniref:UPF3 domain-containing protein n=1 Tax=Puccinia graminis f. sp. tritici (strain CRL 75-36-700-3 / race SCCL) TaxID=418459 RepID=E3KLJ0_PUCGT|nr:uncharacterized protein PGTG_11334 [Puccinia graminis f. sp. tritici CRL 75-36-700-3]EFP85165.2 hypothetical protein PGTG_11334 [Puccinia graminis f. sp. tritici CRL 75-36-700-3]
MSERTKLVVRHLPPSLPEEVFWKTLSRWLEPIPREDGTLDPPRCTATFKSYVPGKTRRNKTKVEIPSRAYIQFATPDQVVEFHQGYASQAFRDSHGNVTFPKVEFAPYQKVAGPPKKIDSRIGTIDTDHDYQAFLARLNAPVPEPNTNPDKPDEAPEKVERPEITPLIEHLRNARQAAQEAALTAKQQRQAATSAKSTSGRSFAGPPQIMKRVATNNESNQPTGVSSRKSGDPASHDPPPHKIDSAPSTSKGVKQTGKSSSTAAASTGQTTSAGSNTKSRPNKPPKSKRAGRGADDQSSHPPATDSQGKSSASTQQPKMILQPPKPSDSNSEKQTSTTPKNPTQSPAKSGKKQGSSLAEQGQGSQNGPTKPPNSTREGPGGSKKSGRGGGAAGRGGKGGKTTTGPGNPTSQATQPSSSSSSAPVATAATQKPKNHEPAKTEPNSSETAAARRRLGNALAGITSKPDHPSTRKKQNSKTAPPSSSNPPPAD